MWPESYHHCHISIHAPMRGRSIVCSIIIWSAGRFQSTPPCGGDPWAPMRSCVPGNFNPRPHAGATGTFLSGSQQDAISIHAPMRGRPKCCGPQASGGHFNPRPHAGATPIAQLAYDGKGFQSTPPCGGDKWTQTCFTTAMIFQSTPPCGGDISANCLVPYFHAISIHAPMRGRPNFSSGASYSSYFNPRPHAGATYPRQHDHPSGQFQSTPPCGGDTFHPSNVSVEDISIHAPMRGRQGIRSPCRADRYFNPRPHAGATRRMDHAGIQTR